MKYKIKYICTKEIVVEAKDVENATFSGRILLQHTPINDMDVDIKEIALIE